MTGMILTGALSDLREREIRLLHDIGEVLHRVSKDGSSDRDRLRDVADDLRRMFFLVVVMGEFNAGKSTFINALLGEALLPVGITPTTEQIELVFYAEQPVRKPVQREDGVREWAHPRTGGPGVVLVDTPGTGSVFQRHEETARRFFHRADLVIFVMSAKRAFAETERIYLELVRDYGKKIIVVVNQSDLLDPREQSEVRRFVQEQVERMLKLKPLIFMVSAKKALANDPNSGMQGVQGHLRATFEQIPPAQQKLLTQLDFAERLMGKHQATLNERLDVIGRDADQAQQVERELETHAAGLDASLGVAAGEVARILGGVRERGLAFINQNFTLRRLRSQSDRDALQKDFEEQVTGRTPEQINDLANDYVNGLVDSTRRYWQGILGRLNRLDSLLDRSVSGVDSGVYAEQRQALQEAIAQADAELASYTTDRVLREIQQHYETDRTGFLNSAVVSFAGAVAAILGVATPGVLAAHPLALIAAVVGTPVAAVSGFFALRYWRKLRRDTKDQFNERMDRLESSFKQAMTELTDRERGRLLHYGRGILEPVYSQFQVMRESAERDVAELGRAAAELAHLRDLVKAAEAAPSSAAVEAAAPAEVAALPAQTEPAPVVSAEAEAAADALQPEPEADEALTEAIEADDAALAAAVDLLAEEQDESEVLADDSDLWSEEEADLREL